MLKHIIAVTIASVFVLAGSASAFNLVSYGGRAEGIENGSHTIGFAIYRTQTEGTPLWEETHKDAQVTDGIFNVILGGISSIPASVWSGDVWIETRLDGKLFSERNPIIGSFESIPTTSLAWTEGTQPVGLTLPYSGTIVGTGRHGAFQVTQTGIGSAGAFKIDNTGSDHTALYAKTNGTGRAGYFSGNVHITGDLTKTYTTGTANIATPIAYGAINADGSVASGTGNFTCTWDATKTRYEITIAGENYDYKNYVTVATTWYHSCIVLNGSESGKLLIRIQYLLDLPKYTRVKSPFHFVTYKP